MMHRRSSSPPESCYYIGRLGRAELCAHGVRAEVLMERHEDDTEVIVTVGLGFMGLFSVCLSDS